MIIFYSMYKNFCRNWWKCVGGYWLNSFWYYYLVKENIFREGIYFFYKKIDLLNNYFII